MSSRLRVSVALALVPLLATSACSTHFDFTPTTAAEVRVASRDVAARGSGRVRSSSDGTMHDVDANSSVTAEGGYSGTMGGLANECGRGAPCPVDDPRATSWTVSTAHTELDVGTILVGGIVVGFVGMNVGCFAADACSTPVKTTVGVTDAVIGVAAVALVVALAVSFRNFRGD